MVSIRSAWSVTILLLIAASILHARDLPPQEIDSLLTRLSDARTGMALQADFREERRIALMKKPIFEAGTIAFLPADKFRREVPGRSLMVSDGKTLWLYYPQLQQAEKYSLAPRSPLRDFLAAMTAGLGLQRLSDSFKIQATETPAGYLLELAPKNAALRKTLTVIRVQIGDDLAVKRLEVFSKNGDRTVTSFANERRARLSPGDFQFAPPPGTSVSEL